MTGYDAGMREYRVAILNRTDATTSEYGRDANGITWETVATVWADVTFSRGKAAMNAGALDAYAVEMVRMNYNSLVNMRSRIQYDGRTFQILPDTFHVDKQGNTIQFHCQAVVDE